MKTLLRCLCLLFTGTATSQVYPYFPPPGYSCTAGPPAQIPYAAASNKLSCSSALTWNPGTATLSVTGSLTTSNPVTVPNGGTGSSTLTAHGLLVGEGISNITSVAPLATDTLLQGQGITSDPAAVPLNNCGDATHALSYSTSTHTFGCQSISGLATPVTVPNGGTGASTLTAHGVVLGEGTATVNTVAAMAADTLLQGQGTGSDPSPVSLTNCGDATHALSYSTSTHTFACQSIPGLTTPVSVPNGGTGLSTLTLHGVLLGEGTSSAGSVAAMASDTLLQGQGASSDPAAVSINNCGSSTTALSYSTSTHSFGCQTISGGSSTAVPGTIPDLVWWLTADSILGTNTFPVPTLGNTTPWVTGPLATLSTGAVTVDSTQLNGHNVLKWPSSSSGRYGINTPFQFSGQVTVFAVVNPSASTNQTLLGAGAAGFQVDVNSGANGFDITKSTVAVIASSSIAMTAGSWYQVNVTWSAVSGVYAFRVGRASAGSGTSVINVIASTTSGIGYNVATSGSDLGSSIAEIIVYDRILSGSEITSIETYLNTKWGV